METRSAYGLSGSGYRHAVKALGVWFYKRTHIQRWAPLYDEYEIERGIKIGRLIISVRRQIQHFKDGEKPSHKDARW
jgi:hypothetical protein